MSDHTNHTNHTTTAHEARLGTRGDASGRNIDQNRAIGQDDPAEGSRSGREADKKSGFPGIPDIGTNAAQTDDRGSSAP